MIREQSLTPHDVVVRLIDTNDDISIARQTELLGISRSSVYYQPKPVEAETLDLLNRTDKIHTDWPTWGSRNIAYQLTRDTGKVIGRKRARTLMEVLGIEAMYPKPNLSLNGKTHLVYPYLLKGLNIVRPNQVWGGDITYIKMHGGFVYV